MNICTNANCIFRDYSGNCIFGGSYCTSIYRRNKTYKKPPLGVVSREIWDRKRQEELAEAMGNYLEAGKKIPKEWLDEYNEISDRWEVKE